MENFILLERKKPGDYRRLSHQNFSSAAGEAHSKKMIVVMIMMLVVTEATLSTKYNESTVFVNDLIATNIRIDCSNISSYLPAPLNLHSLHPSVRVTKFEVLLFEKRVDLMHDMLFNTIKNIHVYDEKKEESSILSSTIDEYIKYQYLPAFYKLFVISLNQHYYFLVCASFTDREENYADQLQSPWQSLLEILRFGRISLCTPQLYYL